MHTRLPQPSFSVRIWNGTPHAFMLKCAELTRTGIGLPAYYNDEVIIPSLMSRGLTLEDARDYNICLLYTSFVICIAGVYIGKKFGVLLSEKAQIAGGIVLILIGLKIFIEHMFLQ